MIQFKRNKKTGMLESWENGEMTGYIETMGDDILGNADKSNRELPKSVNSSRRQTGKTNMRRKSQSK